MPKYILFDRSAADVLMQEPRYQSVDFRAGAEMVDLLNREVNQQDTLEGGLHVIPTDDGLLVVGRVPDHEHCFVFDLEAADPFRQVRPGDALLILQRAMRCAHKMWRQLPAAPCERVVTSPRGGHKRVLFPFPYGSNSQWRLTIQRVVGERDAEDHLVAFRWGRDEAGGADEVPSRSRLHLATSQLRSAGLPTEFPLTTGTHRELPLRVFSLEGEHSGHTALPYEGWLNHLTQPQEQFVLAPVEGPERLEGPAGTGKTLALMLKAVTTLRAAEDEARECHALFLTHSMATQRAIEERLLVIDHERGFQARSRHEVGASLTVTTLQEWCAGRLGKDVSEVEYLDRDAADAKELQVLYIMEVLARALEDDLETHARFMSARFVEFLRREDLANVADMFQHEISVMIKGRAGESLDNYQQLPPLAHNLPLHNDADRGFVFLVYRRYSEALRGTGQFDTDDIVLTAIGQLNTPVWRRRRRQEGFDAVFVDETHLFNLNELSIIHHLTRDPATAPPIIFAVDRSQAVGDRGLQPGVLESGLLPGGEEAASRRVGTVFRSSREILDLALSVTAGGATLFTNFEDPLEEASSAFTSAEERLARPPWLEEASTDEALLATAVDRANEMADRLPGGKSGVAVVVFDPVLMKEARRYVQEGNRPFEVLERRGDLATITRARATGRFVLSAPEFVGGLEFDGVVLVGVDQGRVPPDSQQEETGHFARYSAHNLLYVAISRARFEVCVLVNRARGLSDLLVSARDRGFLAERSDD